ncbi:aminoglycoside phosphotransferase family protein [Streptomyces sp. Root369]|uniref:aminoglycoside phosphotransferase family protein n=1 Tax=Streptomyces sp. Root369 TaxID=1736523 RepID=UPI001F5B75A1|nr:aminoglycoside phosphotransferase family protein [Streptomyces sp. Root369]
MAPLLGCAVDEPVIVRIPAGKLPVVIRTWPKEADILDAVKGVLPHAPECLYRGRDFTIHSYVDGIPVSRLFEAGQHVDAHFVEAFAVLLTQFALVPPEVLPPRPSSWPAGHTDSQAFLRTLAHRADKQIRQPNWPEFEPLFTRLGVPDNALNRFAEGVPAMTGRPYRLLHGDLHRDNLIMAYGGEQPLRCVDWELATYGDPLHDLAIHLIRMGYPREQWDGVVSCWKSAMLGVCRKAADGVDEDLPHYQAFERAQSVYADIMRSAKALETSQDQKSLDQETAAVHRALEAGAAPLRLRDVPDEKQIEKILDRWREERCVFPRRLRRDRASAKTLWQPARHFPQRPDFPSALVRKVLVREGEAPAGHVLTGSAHQNTVVRISEYPKPVVVRRRQHMVRITEGRHRLSQNLVLRVIEESGIPVAAPRVLAAGSNSPPDSKLPWDSFSIHTYESPLGEVPPRHPVNGLNPRQSYAVIDQLAALTQVDVRLLDPLAGEGGVSFLDELRDQLVRLVANLPPETLRLAEILGLPDAKGLRDLLRSLTVSERPPVLVHGNLNPWNLVPRDDDLALTLIDWDMAMVGDALYDMVRHLRLTLTTPGLRNILLDRWQQRLAPEFTRDMSKDWPVFWKLEIVRSAYVDLDRLVTGQDFRAPNVRRAVAAYGTTLQEATCELGLPTRPLKNTHLAYALGLPAPLCA